MILGDRSDIKPGKEVMLEEERLKRQAGLEARIGRMCYERVRLDREIEECNARKAQIDLELAECEGALRENERARIDIQTEAAIDAAKKETDG